MELLELEKWLDKAAGYIERYGAHVVAVTAFLVVTYFVIYLLFTSALDWRLEYVENRDKLRYVQALENKINVLERMKTLLERQCEIADELGIEGKAQ